jgi:tRNA nucleotidyltransferase (CCA-adding enzyme)
MGLVKKVGGVRIFNELLHILSENQVISALHRMQQFELLTFVHPELHFDQRSGELFKAAGRTCNWFDLLYTGEEYRRWLVNLLCLFDSLSLRGVARACRQLALKPKYRQIFAEELAQGRKALMTAEKSLAKGMEPAASQVYHWFSGLSLEMLLYLMARSGHDSARRCLSHYVTQLRQVKIEIDGNDLLQLGLAPGPGYQEVFRQILDARLNGFVNSMEEEVDLARKLADAADN